MTVNQRGEEAFNDYIYLKDLTDQEVRTVLNLVLDILNLDVHRTNATKHGITELQLRNSE